MPGSLPTPSTSQGKDPRNEGGHNFVLFIPQCGHRQKRFLAEQIDPKNGEAKRFVEDQKKIFISRLRFASKVTIWFPESVIPPLGASEVCFIAGFHCHAIKNRSK